MYRDDKPHGVMFHHFWNDVHMYGQGAITSTEFEDIIKYLGPERILKPREWISKHKSGTLSKHDLCITFDDALKCQYDIAKPVLDKYNIKAFFFVYSSPLNGNVVPLEIYRHFRHSCFSSINDFYEVFFKTIDLTEYKDKVNKALVNFDVKEYLSGFDFYTEADRKFRFIRDSALGQDLYNEIMEEMIRGHNIDKNELLKLLWMSEGDVKTLADEGHEIGLHSYDHPTCLMKLSFQKQREQYQNNKIHLENLLNIKITSMSHPCNSYSSKTIDILKDLNIEIGFRANMAEGFPGIYELPREDHIIIHKKIKGEL